MPEEVLIIEHPFDLPKGYVDAEGTMHRRGVMRLATAADEILPMRDPRVRDFPAYLIILLLSRVVVKLGSLPQVHPGIIEGLFTEDLDHLQEMYGRINGLIPQSLLVTCPHCDRELVVEIPPPGEPSATP